MIVFILFVYYLVILTIKVTFLHVCFVRYPNLVNAETLWVLKDWVSGDKTHQSKFLRSHYYKFKKYIIKYVCLYSYIFSLSQYIFLVSLALIIISKNTSVII